jgi:hypothetical protein
MRAPSCFPFGNRRGGVVLRAVLLSLCLAGVARADITISSWIPIFRGVDRATARMTPINGDPELQAVNVVRVDLTDPDVQLLSTPPYTNYLAGTRETAAQTVSSFLQANQLQVAVNANFYSPVDSVGAGGPLKVIGLHISKGFTVSPQDNPQDSAAVLFTTNNHVSFVFTNYPPTNTTGIYTAVSGHYPLVIAGKNVANDKASPIGGLQPRTALGASKDGRYMYFLTVDGRQPGYSNGSLDSQTADWLLRFDVWNAVNMDGGGSTTLVMQDCLGNPVEINRPSYVAAYKRERFIGSHLGVYAKPLATFIHDIRVQSSGSVATLTWQTDDAATSEVQYGSSPAYGLTTPLDSNEVFAHQVDLTGLVPGTTNFFLIHAVAAGVEYTAASCFLLTNTTIPVFPFTQVWKYQTNNLDGVQWMAKGYDDSKWLGQGPGLLYAENNPNVTPRNTPLPPANGQQATIPITYYFRTHFQFTNATAGVTLTFSNYIDDGAVFYLNGVEIQRVRMPDPPEVIFNTTLANGSNDKNACAGDAEVQCPVVFTIGGDTVSSLVKGDNVLAVEVHNFNAGSPDIVFGTALSYGPGPQDNSLPPLIMDPPASLTVNAGQPASFAVTASGTDPLSYRWFFKNQPLGSATTPTYSIPSAASANAGDYFVVVSNIAGVVTSTVATLTVNTVVPRPTLQIVRTGDNKYQLTWTGVGFTLQEASGLESQPIVWTDVPGPVTTSPYAVVPNGTRRLFRLRQ